MLVILAALAVGMAVRLSFAQQILWLDEVTALGNAQAMASVFHAIGWLAVDNNHILNTIHMGLLGDEEGWFWYRVPSLLAGAGTVLLMPFVTIGGRPFERVGATLLVAFSVAMVNHSAEARGYALAAFFAVASLALVEPALRHRGWRAVLWLSLSLGALAHLSFAFAFAALAAANLVGLWARDGGRVAMAASARLFLLPGAFLLWLYLIHYGGMLKGEERNEFSLAFRLGQVTEQLLGTGFAGPLASLALAVGLLLIGVSLLLWRGRWDWAALILAATLGPVAYVWAADPPFFYARYLAVLVPLFYVFVAYLAAEAAERLPRGRWLAAAMVALLVAGQVMQSRELIGRGRGAYPQAVEAILAGSQDLPVTVGGDHDFRNSVLLGFYASRARPGAIRYLWREDWPAEGPDWYIHHVVPGVTKPPPSEISIGSGIDYVRGGVFPDDAEPLIIWHLYRRRAPLALNRHSP